LGRFCGNSTTTQLPLGYLQSSDSQMTVRFVSDNDGLTDRGFRLTFREMMTGCGGKIELSDDQRTANVSSPDYPSAYPHSAECMWVVVAPAGKRVQPIFTGRFGLESHAT
jgi:CUB domain